MAPLYKVNDTATAAEEFDGEMIVIQFKKGTYSTLAGSGKAIFRMLDKPTTIAAVVEAFRAAGEVSVETMREEIEQFVAELARREIVTSTKTGESAVPDAVTDGYTRPEIETFEDLSELMKVDPVHEVDLEAGWPNLPE